MKKVDSLKDRIEKMCKTTVKNSQGIMETIAKIAEREAKSLRADNPAEVIVTTVLSMNQRWDETAKPRAEKFTKNYSQVKTLSELKNLVSCMSEQKFCEKVLGFKISKKGFWRYQMLIDMISGFEEHQKRCGIADDWTAMQEWAKKVDINDLDNDIIGRIKNVGLATVQNLRLICGIDTVKPDVHVKNALKELGLGNDIGVAELIAEITGYSAIEIDQIFWYWDKNRQQRA